jgi:hypothetical protein
VSEPGDAVDRLAGRVRRLRTGGAIPIYSYEAQADWERDLHERIGHPWPCPEAARFGELWSEIERSLTEQGLTTGRGAYGGWDDGDPGFARAVWCLTHHLQAKSVVETGVARGITSRVILEALEQDGAGSLSSIDLPALDTSIHEQIGAAVPARLRGRWTYLTGTSRRQLPPLLAGLQGLDLFVHDSSHTTRNLTFELEQAWKAMGSGALVADDIERNEAFGRFTSSHPEAQAFIAAADDAGAQFGILLKGF